MAAAASPCRPRGFTLIEMVVVVMIVGILASAAMPLAALHKRRSQEAELRQALRTLRTAIDAHKRAWDTGRIEKKTDASGYPVSLDALDPARFQAMADTDVDVKQVLRGIDAAMDAGLGPVKVNMVVQKGRNDDQILPMVRYFRHRPVTLRFIEYMDVGQTNGWNLREVLSWQDIRALIHQAHPLEPLDRHDPAATALRWRFADGHGELGFIASVTQAFCGDCTRLRLSTEGMLYTCLFAHRGYDLRALVREQALPDEAVAAHLSGLWRARQDRYSELRHQHVPAHHAPAAPTSSTGSTGSTGSRIEMSYIGG